MNYPVADFQCIQHTTEYNEYFRYIEFSLIQIVLYLNILNYVELENLGIEKRLSH